MSTSWKGVRTSIRDKLKGVRVPGINLWYILYCIFFCTITGTAYIYINGERVREWRFYYKLNFIQHSKRYNVFTDVRPRYIFGSQNKYQNWHCFDKMTEIPQIIHQTDKDEIIPFVHKKYMQSWLKHNPHWQHWYWTDEDVRNLIETRYPNFLYFFDKYHHNIQRADVFRYFVLHEFGGIYADCDVECLKPLDVKIIEHDCILSTEPLEHALFLYNQSKFISNGYMACRPRHWFYKYVIDNLAKNNKPKNGDYPGVLSSTGPVMLDKTYDFFNRSGLSDLPYVADSDVYQPKMDPRQLARFAVRCDTAKDNLRESYNSSRLAKICKPMTPKLFVNGPTEASYTIHHWSHKWINSIVDHYGVRNDNRTFHVSTILT